VTFPSRLRPTTLGPKTATSGSRKPIGWLYLFQSEEYWEPQSKRLAGYEGWTHHEARSRVWFEPVDDFYTMLAEGSA